MKGSKALGGRYAHIKRRKYHPYLNGKRFVLCGCTALFALPDDRFITGFNRTVLKSNDRSFVRWR